MLYETLKQKKEELGLTTERLSQLSGVPVGTINKILNGETKSSRYDTPNALEAVLFPIETYPNMFCDSASPCSQNVPGNIQRLQNIWKPMYGNIGLWI